MKNIRNFITQYFPKNDKLFYLDDDIIDIYSLSSSNKLEPIDSLDELIKFGFNLCEKKDCRLFSIYPVQNAYFMKNSITRGLVYCMGGCYGIINEPSLTVCVDNKEDFERTLQYFMNTKGGVIRFNYVCCGTKGYVGKGGMQTFDRSNLVILEEAEKLVEKYGDYCSLHLTKKSKKPEIKLKRIVLEQISKLK
jgi:hypothetical protein